LDASTTPEIDPERLPRHVAIIMDGNGRWAERRGLSRLRGHREGKESVRAVVEKARRMGLEYLTLFAFSTENWSRPRQEVHALMALLRRYLRTELRKMMDNEIRLRAIGDITRLPVEVQRLLVADMEATKDNKGMTVFLAVSYGGRDDIVRAARALARAARDGEVDPEAIDEALFTRHVATGDVPEPDLLIRTGGEMRISNFFLWQAAYSEIYVTGTLWPEFREREFVEAIQHYQRRERRFGGVGAGAYKGRLRAAP
jgi:undecaprenyl diphosphate synthase